MQVCRRMTTSTGTVVGVITAAITAPQTCMLCSRLRQARSISISIIINRPIHWRTWILFRLLDMNMRHHTYHISQKSRVDSGREFPRSLFRTCHPQPRCPFITSSTTREHICTRQRRQRRNTIIMRSHPCSAHHRWPYTTRIEK